MSRQEDYAKRKAERDALMAADPTNRETDKAMMGGLLDIFDRLATATERLADEAERIGAALAAAKQPPG